MPLFHPRMRLFRDASVFGGSPEKLSLGLARGTRRRLTITVPSPHFTCVVRRSGCLPKPLTSDFPHVNWDPNLLDRLLWLRCSVRWRLRLKLTSQFNKIHPVFHVSKINPVFRFPLQPLISAPLPPRLIEGSVVWLCDGYSVMVLHASFKELRCIAVQWQVICMCTVTRHLLDTNINF